MQMTVKLLFRTLQFLILIVSFRATHHTVPLFFQVVFECILSKNQFKNERLKC